jgi:hypothetical protein
MRKPIKRSVPTKERRHWADSLAIPVFVRGINGQGTGSWNSAPCSTSAGGVLLAMRKPLRLWSGMLNTFFTDSKGVKLRGAVRMLRARDSVSRMWEAGIFVAQFARPLVHG